MSTCTCQFLWGWIIMSTLLQSLHNDFCWNSTGHMLGKLVLWTNRLVGVSSMIVTRRILSSGGNSISPRRNGLGSLARGDVSILLALKAHTIWNRHVVLENLGSAVGLVALRCFIYRCSLTRQTVRLLGLVGPHLFMSACGRAWGRGFSILLYIGISS